jgi:hypothetical protein
MKDVVNELQVTQLLIPATYTTDQNCTSVDMQGYEGVMFVANIGNSLDTLAAGTAIELELEESDDDSTFTDVADADLENYVDGTNDGCWGLINAPTEDSTAFKCGYKGNKRYVRPVINFVGTHSSGTPLGVVALRRPFILPAS